MSEIETQRTLLQFYGQQLVAHAATFFAALGTCILFTHYFRPSQMLWWLRLSYAIIAAGLFTLAAYTAFRFLLYGRLAQCVLTNCPIENETLRAYQYRLANQEMPKEAEGRSCTFRLFFALIVAFTDLDTLRCRIILGSLFFVVLVVLYLLLPYLVN